MRRRRPSEDAVRLIGAWPEGQWLTEGQVQGLADEVGVGVPVVKVLAEGRRLSWLIAPPREGCERAWTRTPTGARESSASGTVTKPGSAALDR